MEHLDRIQRKANEVREATVAAYANTAVERYVTGFNSLMLDKSTISVGPIWSDALFKCSVLAESSFFLAANGFYEEACIFLRSMLEGFLIRLYWHIRHRKGEIPDFIEDGKLTNDYAKWELGLTDHYPKLQKDVWPTLLEESAIREYERVYTLKSKVEMRLNILNKFVHGRPSSRHYGGAYRSSSLNIGFKSKHFDEWFENLRAVFAFVWILSCLEYPALFATKTSIEFRSLELELASRIQNILQ